jgi:peptidylprolyl isomerase
MFVKVMTKRLFLLASFAIAFAFAIDVQAQKRPRKTPAKRIVSAGAVKTASGLTYIVTQKGTGRRPKVGETVVVHYTGTLTNGVKFDSSRDSNKEFSFPLGRGRVIKGWDEGIAKLRVGDQAILIIPPSIGYGARGAGGVIPPNATLIFIVELVDIKE